MRKGIESSALLDLFEQFLLGKAIEPSLATGVLLGAKTSIRG
jgi:hypothetical protein